jgi:hypothetical protein
VAQDFVEVTLPVTQAGSLLIAAGWCNLNNARPFTWPAGWSKLDDQQLGAGNEPCGSIASKVSTVAGSEAVRMSGDTVTSQWAIAAVEFLAG